MQLFIKARHTSLTESLREYVHIKIADAVARLFDREALRVEVELSEAGQMRDRNNKECRITLHIPRGRTLVITELDDNMYKAIDLAHDRLLNVLVRERDRRRQSVQRRKWARRDRKIMQSRNFTLREERLHEPVWQKEVELYEASRYA